VINTLNIANQEHRRVIQSLAEYASGRRSSIIAPNYMENIELRRIVHGIADSKRTGKSAPSTDKVHDVETKRVLDSIITEIGSQ